MWPSEERFCERGLGAAALAGRRVVCWCTAEYVSAARCGVGIETEPLYMGRGIATRRMAGRPELFGAYGALASWLMTSVDVAPLVLIESGSP